MAKTSKREAILRAVESLVLREGIVALTLESVAREAGVSKGGLLYYFRSKDQMVEGLVRRLIENFDADFVAFRQKMGNGRGAAMRAFVAALLHGGWKQHGCGREFFAALLAILATSPKLAEPLRQSYLGWQKELESDGMEPSMVALLRLSLDGLWMSEMLGIAVLSPQRRQQVVELIESLCQCGPASGGPLPASV